MEGQRRAGLSLARPSHGLRADLADRLRSSDTPVTMVVGAAGAGKSGVLWQSVQELEAEEHWPILAFRLDRLESMASTSDLGDQLGLGVSPVTALAAVAAGGPCLLVVDQLDAVSFASGRLPSGFNTVVDLIREAAAFPQMRVLLACRAFDVDNDHRIRRLVADNEVGRLDVAPHREPGGRRGRRHGPVPCTTHRGPAVAAGVAV